MGDLFFFESDEAPQARERVRLTDLTATPYPDGSRVRVKVQITPFLECPNLEIYARKVGGPIVAEMSVIETMQHVLEFTMHLRHVEDTVGDYLLTAELFYDDRANPQHTQEATFSIVESD